MKFKVEIDDDDIIGSLESSVAGAIAYQMESKLNFKFLKEQAEKAFDEKKNKALKDFKKGMDSWDKESMALELNRLMGNIWINSVTDKLIQKIQVDSIFIAKLAEEIIKQRFK